MCAPVVDKHVYEVKDNGANIHRCTPSDVGDKKLVNSDQYSDLEYFL